MASSACNVPTKPTTGPRMPASEHPGACLVSGIDGKTQRPDQKCQDLRRGSDDFKKKIIFGDVNHDIESSPQTFMLIHQETFLHFSYLCFYIENVVTDGKQLIA